jgi:hypothetical protein
VRDGPGRTWRRKAGENEADDVSGAPIRFFVESGGDQKWMEEQGGGVLQDSSGLEAVDPNEFSGFDSFFNEATEHAKNLFTPAGGGVRPNLNDVPVGFKNLSVLAKLLFSFTVEFKDDGFDAGGGRDASMTDFFDEDFYFCQPFADDCVENVGLGFEITVDVGMGHAERASDVHHRELVIAVATQKRLRGLKNHGASFACGF